MVSQISSPVTPPLSNQLAVVQPPLGRCVLFFCNSRDLGVTALVISLSASAILLALSGEVMRPEL